MSHFKLNKTERQIINDRFKDQEVERRCGYKLGELKKVKQTYSNHVIFEFENGNRILHYLTIKSII